MKTYEFSLVFRHTSKTDKNIKMKFEGEDNKKIVEQAVVWLGSKLRSKIQYQWELPSDQTVMEGISKMAGTPDGYGVISNRIDGIIIKVRDMVKPAKLKVA